MEKQKQMRREVFLQARERVVRWARLIKKIAAYDPKAGPQGGRAAYPMERMLRIYCLQNGSGDADLSRKEAGYENEVLGRFAGVKRERIPDETSWLHFRHWLERHGLCEARFEEAKAPMGVDVSSHASGDCFNRSPP